MDIDKYSNDHILKYSGLKDLSEFESNALAIYFRGMATMTTTEWRLERVGGNPEYYKFAFNALFTHKAILDYYKEIGRKFFTDGNFGKPGLGKIADLTYENLTGEKLED